jgi:hypothetical protein
MTRPAVQQTLFGFTRQFWILVFGTLINSTGSALVFPFIALYIGRTFGVTEAETGLVFTFHAAVALFSGAAGGALKRSLRAQDRHGHRANGGDCIQYFDGHRAELRDDSGGHSGHRAVCPNFRSGS